MISVVMVSYLGPYKGSRVEPIKGFIRAVESFLAQTHMDSELIIVSDGCEITERVWSQRFAKHDRIKFYMRPKAQGWPGEHRQFGIEMATGDLITYLDADDGFGPTRLEKLVEATKDRPFILDQLYTIPSPSFKFRKYRPLLETEWMGIKFWQYRPSWMGGTYQICHQKNLNVSWKTTHHRGEDAQFVKQLLKISPKGYNPYVEIGEYFVCHHPDMAFDV